MSAEIVNLRRARKAKARKEAEATAADNRVRFGRPKVEREVAEKREAIEARRLEGHRRETDPDGGDT